MNKQPEIDAIFNHLPQAVVALDRQNRVVSWNRAATDLFGWQREEILGQPCPLASPGAIAGWGEREKSLAAVHKDGQTLLVDLHSASFKSSANPSAGRILTFEAARENLTPRDLFDQYLHSGPGIFYTCRVAGDFGATFVSDNVRDLLGYAPQDFTGDSSFWFDNVHPDDRPRVKDRLRQLLAKGRITNEYRFRHRDGSFRWMHDESSVIASPRGGLKLIAGHWVDISPRRQMEEELKASKARLHRFFEFAPDAIFLHTLEGVFTDGNSAAEKMIGYDREALIGKNFFELDLIPPAHRGQVAALLKRNQAGEIVGPVEIALRRRDGSLIPLEIRTLPLEIDGQRQVLGIARDISERKRMENQLKEKSELLEATLGSLDEAIFVIKPETRTILSANRAVESVFGYAAEEVIGRSTAFLHESPEAFEEWGLKSAPELERSGLIQGEWQMRRRDGSIFWAEITVNAIHPDLGWHRGVVSVVRDISERRRTQQQLLEARQRYQMIADNTPIFLYTIDRRGHFSFAEGDGLSRIELTRQDLIGQSAYHIFGALPWQLDTQTLTVSEAIDRALAGESLTGTVYLQQFDRYFEARLMPQSDEAGRPLGAMGLAIDVTERWRAQIALHQSQERFRAVVNNAPVVLFSLDREGRFTFNEGKGLERAGLNNSKIVGQSAFDLYGRTLYHLDGGETISGSEAFRRALAGEALNGVAQVGEIYYDTRLFTLFDPQGEVIGVNGLSVDITDRCRAEEELRRSERKYRRISTEFRTLLDGIPDSLALLSPDLKIVWANRTGIQGCDEDQLQQLSCYQVWGEGDQPCPDCPVLSAFASGKTESATLSAADGRLWGIKAFPLVAEDGQVTGVIKWASDITERVRLQEEATRNSRLASLGELAAGVAHEINNPNALILLNAPILADTWPDIATILDARLEKEGDFRLGRLPYSRLRELMPDLHGELLEGAQRIRRIVEDLKDFVRHEGGEERAAVDLNEVVRAALRLVASRLQQATSRLEVALAPELPPVSGHFQRLEQIVVNLLVNACQALPAAERAIRVATAFQPERQRLIVTVQDQGQGIRPEHLDRLTDPFFTTKRESGGTGLGLSVSARIAREHGGKLVFHSVPEQGTTVHLELPLESPQP